MRKRKFALVLSGGGFKGSFQLGAINHIKENWLKITGLKTPMKFDIIAGVSVGALNGSLVAMDKLDILNDLWNHQIAKNGVSEIYTSDFIDTANKSDTLKLKLNLKQIAKRLIPQIDFKFNLLSKLGLLFSSKKRQKVIDQLLIDIEQGITVNLPKIKSIADNTPLRKKLQKYVTREDISGTQFLCGFVSLNSGKYHGVLHNQFGSDKDFVNAILASTSIPMIWNPVREIAFESSNGFVTSKNNIDGGIRNATPLGDVIQLINRDPEQCDYELIIINCNNGILQQKDFDKKSIGGIASRSLYEIALSEIFNNDLDHFLKVNEIVKQIEQSGCPITIKNAKNIPLKSFKATVIQPDHETDLGNALVANERLIAKRWAIGAKMAQLAFENKDFHNG